MPGRLPVLRMMSALPGPCSCIPCLLTTDQTCPCTWTSTDIVAKQQALAAHAAAQAQLLAPPPAVHAPMPGPAGLPPGMSPMQLLQQAPANLPPGLAAALAAARAAGGVGAKASTPAVAAAAAAAAAVTKQQQQAQGQGQAQGQLPGQAQAAVGALGAWPERGSGATTPALDLSVGAGPSGMGDQEMQESMGTGAVTGVTGDALLPDLNNRISQGMDQEAANNHNGATSAPPPAAVTPAEGANAAGFEGQAQETGAGAPGEGAQGMEGVEHTGGAALPAAQEQAQQEGPAGGQAAATSTPGSVLSKAKEAVARLFSGAVGGAAGAGAGDGAGGPA